MTEEIRFLSHRIGAVILIVISLIQLGYFLFNKKGQRDIKALIPSFADVMFFWKSIRYYLGHSKDFPQNERYNYAEKAEYLALIWGTVIMGSSGLILWFPEYFITFLPAWIFEASEIIHYYEAWLATLAIVIWHFFFIIFHPKNFPMSITWIDGKITEEELKEDYPLEYEEYIKK